ncbi:unnamed protein product [Medioppia subpectinata]|uniref:FAD-dependent oxidoreductase domain-containing protein 1 n=1 Tax=Medioppia subpectinata TaxID=1979941 RepID=A0A7R9PX85_9ACAR|nr:unnamed protein product [Medioppia subpectinata]CAG2104745.1 unnamed protein product [Medioppia subpectinata]
MFNNNNDNKNNESDKSVSNKTDSKSLDVRSDDKSGVESTAKEVETDEYKWGPNEGVYDPSTDEGNTSELIGFKYPQYFTRRYKQMGFKRAVNIIKDDLSLLKEGRIHRAPYEQPFPHQVDIAIFGGGIIGSSIAYFLKQRAPQSFTCAVIERDPTYTRASTTQSIGGIRQQFSLKENIMMSMYGIDFLRDVKKHLSVLDNEPPDVSFHPHGYLVLATNSGAQQLVENHKLQTDLGAYVELYTPDRLKEKFPWLNTDGIAIGSYGVQNEGWFDPWALLLAMKTKAQTLGVEYLQADILDFNIKSEVNVELSTDQSGDAIQRVNHVIVRQPDGYVKQLEFAMGIVCCGANSAFIADKLEYGKKRGIRSHLLPVEPRKRYVYVFNAPDGPGIDFPLLIDPSSAYCRREGLGGNFICGRNPSDSEEPDVSNLDVDYSYFDSHIYPQLAHRVPSFGSAKLKGAWSGYYEYNTLDQNPIIGRDLYYGICFRPVCWRPATD